MSLIRACEIAGGEAALASHLGLSAQDVVDYVAGAKDVPMHVFLKAVDIVFKDNYEKIARNTALLDEIRERRARAQEVCQGNLNRRHPGAQ
ncbi:MAG: hypothetical protein JO035_07640 [Betaproteobacteria bacterium]|nr:hypothetical protein [Betaproteobacteria bacterium]